ncbi:OadG family protein [Carnobacterium sp. CS13]|uniref:OadG family protein n=1 Tax=Carnobacterium sp. CS13 TaxID=2800128 RepID=UPI001912E7BB|nr:OadG family protein [Carnobacterium sp. CS13]QQP69362.1 OadG family protein [Carnobacterium sp. CS13]
MRFTLIDGVVVTITSLVMVFLALIILLFTIELIHYMVKRTGKKEPAVTTLAGIQVLAKDEETELVAALMALVLANEDQQNKSYQITEIKRIR